MNIAMKQNLRLLALRFMLGYEKSQTFWSSSKLEEWDQGLLNFIKKIDEKSPKITMP